MDRKTFKKGVLRKKTEGKDTLSLLFLLPISELESYKLIYSSDEGSISLLYPVVGTGPKCFQK